MKILMDLMKASPDNVEGGTYLVLLNKKYENSYWFDENISCNVEGGTYLVL